MTFWSLIMKCYRMLVFRFLNGVTKNLKDPALVCTYTQQHLWSLSLSLCNKYIQCGPCTRLRVKFLDPEFKSNSSYCRTIYIIYIYTCSYTSWLLGASNNQGNMILILKQLCCSMSSQYSAVYSTIEQHITIILTQNSCSFKTRQNTCCYHTAILCS